MLNDKYSFTVAFCGTKIMLLIYLTESIDAIIFKLAFPFILTLGRSFQLFSNVFIRLFYLCYKIYYPTCNISTSSTVEVLHTYSLGN